MPRNLILCGGIFHEFHQSSDELARVLAPLGIDSVVEDDIEGGLLALADGNFDLLTVNALRWEMHGEKYDPYREEWAMSLSPEGKAAIATHLEAGGALLGLHTASICFSDWPEWGDMLGGSWQWGRSWHPPPSPLGVTPVAHPLMAGIEPFSVEDEVYTDLELRPGINPLLYSTEADGHPPQPLLWLHDWSKGRVVYDALGHDAESLRVPAHSEVLRRAVAWSLQA